MSKVDELVKLSALLKSNAIDAEEFEMLKSEVMRRSEGSQATGQPMMDVTGGAANRMVNLEWARFVLGLIVIIIIGAVVLSQLPPEMNPFYNGPPLPPGYKFERSVSGH